MRSEISGSSYLVTLHALERSHCFLVFKAASILLFQERKGWLRGEDCALPCIEPHFHSHFRAFVIDSSSSSSAEWCLQPAQCTYPPNPKSLQIMKINDFSKGQIKPEDGRPKVIWDYFFWTILLKHHKNIYQVPNSRDLGKMCHYWISGDNSYKPEQDLPMVGWPGVALTTTVVRSQFWGRETKILRGRLVGSYCLGVRQHFY